MARYTAEVHTPRPIEQAFAYLSDFSTTEEWDPGTSHAARLDAGPIRQGTRFKLRARFLSRESDLVYEIKTHYHQDSPATDQPLVAEPSWDRTEVR